MSEKLGPLTFGKKEEQIFLGREIAQHRDYSEAHARSRSTDEVKRIVLDGYSAAREHPRRRTANLSRRIAEALLEREVLDGEEIAATGARRVACRERDGSPRRAPKAPRPRRADRAERRPSTAQRTGHAPDAGHAAGLSAWSRPRRSPAARSRCADGRDGSTLARHTLVMGILNVTPDSFSDGGPHAEPEAAIGPRRGRWPRRAPTSIDVGGESTRPGARRSRRPRSSRRVVPGDRGDQRQLAVARLGRHDEGRTWRAARSTPAPTSSTTCRRSSDPAMLAARARARASRWSLMHMRGTPRDDAAGHALRRLCSSVGPRFLDEHRREGRRQPGSAMIRSSWIRAWDSASRQPATCRSSRRLPSLRAWDDRS